MNRISVAGFDPSLRNWGIAEGYINLATGLLEDVTVSLVRSEPCGLKQVRKNSDDLMRASALAKVVVDVSGKHQLLFAEVPVGSQSSRAQTSYGICVGILGTLKSQGCEVIEVSPTEVKVALSGSKTASKDDMIQAALHKHPDLNFPRTKGKVVASVSEHMADAVGAIYAGIQTPMYKQLLNLLRKQNENHI